MSFLLLLATLSTSAFANPEATDADTGTDLPYRTPGDSLSRPGEVQHPRYTIGADIGWPVTSLSVQYRSRPGWTLDTGVALYGITSSGHLRGGFGVDSGHGPTFVRFTPVFGLRLGSDPQLYDGGFVAGPSAALRIDVLSTGQKRRVWGGVGFVVGMSVPFRATNTGMEFGLDLLLIVPEVGIGGRVAF